MGRGLRQLHGTTRAFNQRRRQDDRGGGGAGSTVLSPASDGADRTRRREPAHRPPTAGGRWPTGRAMVGHQAQPLDRLTVRRHRCGGGPTPFDDQLVDVGGVGGVEGLQGEVVDDEQVDPQQLADSASWLLSTRLARSRRSMRSSALDVHAVAPAHGGVGLCTSSPRATPSRPCAGGTARLRPGLDDGSVSPTGSGSQAPTCCLRLETLRKRALPSLRHPFCTNREESNRFPTYRFRDGCGTAVALDEL